MQAWIGTDRETWSLPVQEAAVDLATDESCAKAVAKLKRHHPGVEMGRTSALRLLHEHGANARKFIDAKLAGARQLDETFDDLHGLAVLKGWTEKAEVRGLADGAIYIRPRMAETFHSSSFRFILDRPHCKEHLSAAGSEMSPITAITAGEWATAALSKLEAGRSEEVVAELRRAWEESGDDPRSRNDALRLATGYFERNGDAVAYAEYRALGWSTASSEIESCHGTIVQPRLKVGGAWWRPDSVDDILALRMLKANGWWADYWTDQRQQWRNRAAIFAEARPSLAA